MDRRTEDTDYVLRNLQRTRQEVVANPQSFEPDALERIDKGIASIEEIRLAATVA